VDAREVAEDGGVVRLDLKSVLVGGYGVLPAAQVVVEEAHAVVDGPLLGSLGRLDHLRIHLQRILSAPHLFETKAVI
jgi:hypothetical protein